MCVGIDEGDLRACTWRQVWQRSEHIQGYRRYVSSRKNPPPVAVGEAGDPWVHEEIIHDLGDLNGGGFLLIR